MRKITALFLIVFSILLCDICTASEIIITNTNPQIRTGNSMLDFILNQAVTNTVDDVIREAHDSLLRFSHQEELARGFANANTYSSHAGTFQGYQNYSKFAITVGVMAGAQGPTTDFDYYDGLASTKYYDKIRDQIIENGDLYTGVAAGISFINFGYNAKSLIPGLYLNLKFGSLTHKSDNSINNQYVKDNYYRVKSTIIGVGIRYSLVKPDSASSLFKWRGISVGTGVTYHSSDISLQLKLKELSRYFDEDQTVEDITGYVLLDPSILLQLKIKTTTIPFDIVTSAKILNFFNLTLGAGVDVNIGKTNIGIEGTGNVNVDIVNDPNNNVQSITPGVFNIVGGTNGISPKSTRVRFMTGLGFNFGPVKLDIPAMYYIGAGASAGITFGIVI